MGQLVLEVYESNSGREWSRRVQLYPLIPECTVLETVQNPELRNLFHVVRKFQLTISHDRAEILLNTQG